MRKIVQYAISAKPGTSLITASFSELKSIPSVILIFARKTHSEVS